MYCPECKKITSCSAESFLLSQKNCRTFESKKFKDIQWFERGRYCEECNKGFTTVELNYKFMIELIELRNLVVELAEKSEQYLTGPQSEKLKVTVTRIESNRSSNSPDLQDAQKLNPMEIAMIKFEEINKLPYGLRGNAMIGLANQLGIANSTLSNWKTIYERTGKIEDKRKTTGPRKKIQTDHLKRWKEIDMMLKNGHSKKEIMQKLRVSESQIQRVKSRYKKRWLSEKSL